jgi:predicted MPP superfamily phosphohydrolase
MFFVIAILALIGHAALLIALVNRYHAVLAARGALKCCDLAWCLWAVGVPLATGVWVLQNIVSGRDFTQSPWVVPIGAYTALCLAATGFAILHRIVYAWNNAATTPRLTVNHTELISLPQKLGFRPTLDATTTWCSRLPGNDILKLSIHKKHLRLARLDRALEGLTITHLSDLHMTGQLSKDFYREVVDSAMALDSDMVVITGDIVEKSGCLPWISELFGPLDAPLGVYYVLGNHEERIRDEALVRSTLDSAGMVGLGSRCLTLRTRDREILLAGTEMPWYPPAPDMETHRLADEATPYPPLRILLSHSPDQLRWAKDHRFDLMLAGHTHGGQVRLPLIGPILSPSLNGIRHAAGTFDCPPTLLHVSRGLAGTRPLRLNCAPEIAQLILHGEDP